MNNTFSGQVYGSPIDSLQPMMWDNVMDQQMVASYNQVCSQQHSAKFLY